MGILSFNEYNNYQETNLLVVDVQKSFSDFFTPMYLSKVNEYCNSFTNVYQIWDNHIDGNIVDKDYLYDDNPTIPVHGDLYQFPNQKQLIEKRYNYGVDADFYKPILEEGTYQTIKEKEQNRSLKKGDIFLTTKNTCIVFIGNKHQWFHIGKKMLELFNSLKGKNITIIGGSDSECLDDIYIAAESLGVLIKRDWKYIYTAVNCPI